MTKPALQPTEEGHAEVDQGGGKATPVHQVAREDEQRHGKEGKDVKLAEQPLRQGGHEARTVGGKEGENGRGPDHVGDRRTGEQPDDHEDHDERSLHVTWTSSDYDVPEPAGALDKKK